MGPNYTTFEASLALTGLVFFCLSIARCIPLQTGIAVFGRVKCAHPHYLDPAQVQPHPATINERRTKPMRSDQGLNATCLALNLRQWIPALWRYALKLTPQGLQTTETELLFVSFPPPNYISEYRKKSAVYSQIKSAPESFGNTKCCLF